MEVQVPIFENIPKKVVSTVALFLKVLILAFFANICLNFTAPNSNSILVVIVFCTNKMKNKKFYIFKNDFKCKTILWHNLRAWASAV